VPTFSKINVIDLESTCWNNKVDIRPEIIQIGICIFDPTTKEITKENSFLCKPLELPLSTYCTTLTGITTNQVKSSPPLRETINTIKKQYPIRSQPIAAWGESDRIQLLSEFKRKGIDCPLFDSYINVSLLFNLFKNIKKRTNLLKALEMCNSEPIGNWHNARDDAVNTARILKYLIENQV